MRFTTRRLLKRVVKRMVLENHLKYASAARTEILASLAAETNMPYLVNGGADALQHDTDKVYKMGPLEKRVSGTNLVPIIEALKHYEAVYNANERERQKAIC